MLGSVHGCANQLICHASPPPPPPFLLSFFSGLVLIVSNSTASGCAASYSVKQGDSCSSITNDLKLQSNVLQTLNPNINCNRLYLSQQLCVKVANITAMAATSTIVCGQTYTTVAGDTCTSIQGTFQINGTWLAS